MNTALTAQAIQLDSSVTLSFLPYALDIEAKLALALLALVLLDRGLERAARSELERVAEQMLADFGVGELSGPVSEAEIEAAMQRAEREVAADSGPHGVAISAARKFSSSSSCPRARSCSIAVKILMRSSSPVASALPAPRGGGTL